MSFADHLPASSLWRASRKERIVRITLFLAFWALDMAIYKHFRKGRWG